MENTFMGRRAVLSLGGLMLISACSTHDKTSTPTPTLPSPSPTSPSPSPPPLSPSSSPSPTPSTSASSTQSHPRPPGCSHPARQPRQQFSATPSGGSSATPSAGPSAAAGEPEYFVHKGPKAIALTIDDGPNPEWTPQVLDLLQRYGITATFCQVGRLVSANPGLVREVADAGHLIANHTWTHADLSNASSAAVQSQLERTSDALEQVSGRRPELYRAPYGAWSTQSLATARQLGMRPLDWSVDPRDWSRPGASNIVKDILSNTRTGSIILEHDGGGDRSQTVAALKIVLPRLIDSGYRFVTP